MKSGFNETETDIEREAGSEEHNEEETCSKEILIVSSTEEQIVIEVIPDDYDDGNI